MIKKLRKGEWVDAGGNVRSSQLSGNSRGMTMYSNISRRNKMKIKKEKSEKLSNTEKLSGLISRTRTNISKEQEIEISWKVF